MSPTSSKASHYPDSTNPDAGSEIQFLEEHIKRIPQPVFELLDSLVPKTFSMGEKYDGGNQSFVAKPNAGEFYQNVYSAFQKTYSNGQPIHHGYQHWNNSNKHVHSAPASHAPIHHALNPPTPIHYALIPPAPIHHAPIHHAPVHHAFVYHSMQHPQHGHNPEIIDLTKTGRYKFTTLQKKKLEESFKFEGRYLCETKRAALAQKLGCPEEKVKNWFQNRRMKENREKKGKKVIPRVIHLTES